MCAPLSTPVRYAEKMKYGLYISEGFGLKPNRWPIVPRKGIGCSWASETPRDKAETLSRDYLGFHLCSLFPTRHQALPPAMSLGVHHQRTITTYRSHPSSEIQGRALTGPAGVRCPALTNQGWACGWSL